MGAVTNGDDLIERFSGLTARFDSAALGTDRLHASVAIEDYREQWDTATRDAVRIAVATSTARGGMSRRNSPSRWRAR